MLGIDGFLPDGPRTAVREIRRNPWALVPLRFGHVRAASDGSSGLADDASRCGDGSCGGSFGSNGDYQLQGLPLLSRLPGLGYVFGNRVKTEGRRELVVLLTPHIWSPDQAMAHAPAPHGAPGPPGGAAPGAKTSFEVAM